MTAPKLTEAAIRAGASEQSFQRGRDLFRGGAIANAAIQGQRLSGECEGTGAPFYKVRVELDSSGVRAAACTCPYDFGGYCKHIIALLLAYAHRPKQFAVRREPAELLSAVTREQLLAVVTKLLREQPDLYDWVEAALASPVAPASGKAKSSKSKRKEIDTSVYRRRVRGIMHSLDHMRMSEAYWHVGGLVGELDGVRQSAIEFLNAGQAESALQILLTLLKESHGGFEYIDDSNGELGDFLSGLGETLAEVILSLDLSQDEREDLAGDLDELHDKLSDYGIDGLSVAVTAAEYGWDAVPRARVIERAGAAEEEIGWDDEDKWDEGAVFDEEDEFDRLGAQRADDDPEQVFTRAKLNVLNRQGRTDEYLALCQREGEHLRYALKLDETGRSAEAVSYGLKHLTMAADALAMAQKLRESGRPDEAVKIGERGLKLNGRKAALGEWLGPVEEARGRKSQALEAWRLAFAERPSLAAYQTIKRLAGSRLSKLKPEIMKSLEKFYDKRPLAEVLLFEREWDAAIKVADRRGADHTVVEKVAGALIAHRPEWVIRASVKQAEDLIAQTKSNLYPAAADWLGRAKAAYAKSGRTSEWQKYLRRLKEEYKRRPALQAQLSRL